MTTSMKMSERSIKLFRKMKGEKRYGRTQFFIRMTKFVSPVKYNQLDEAHDTLLPSELRFDSSLLSLPPIPVD